MRLPLFDRELLKIAGEAAVWLGIAAIAWLLTYQIPSEEMLFRWGAAIWPRAVIIGMALGAVVQFIARYRAFRAERRVESAEAAAQSETDVPALARTLGMVALPLLYLFLLPRMGYYLITPFFIGALIYLFGLRRPVRLLVTTTAIYLAFLLVFTKMLFVPMPTGYWTGFYEVNVWIVELIG